MSVNSKPPALKINQWLNEAADKLGAAGIPSARLDAELILAHALEHDRTWIIAHNDKNADFTEADKLINRRVQRTPLAYLTGHKEFYGRDFTVNEQVLIPRPDTEEIIDQLKQLEPQGNQKLIDVGTGSGAIAITAKLEFPDLYVEAVDVSPEALTVAKANTRLLQADIRLYQSDLLDNARHSYDFILANLPYVDRVWERSLETDHEPSLALFADDDGLELIKKCIEQARNKLTENGYLLLEADPRQFDSIISFALQHGFELVRVNEYAVTLQRY